MAILSVEFRSISGLQKGVSMKGELLDEAGRSELHYLARDGNIAEMAAIINSGANVNLRDDDGRTPLHAAAQEQQGAAVKLLLDSGAECDPADNDGNTPLMNAVFNYTDAGDCIQLLRSSGANPHHQNSYGQTPLGLARLIANTDVAKFFADIPSD